MNSFELCPIIRDLLPMHIDGLTEPETSAFVERYLAGCAACRAVRRNLLHAPLPEERAKTEFLSALRRDRRRRRRRNLRILAALLLIAAICLLPLPRRVDISDRGILWRAGRPDEEVQSVHTAARGVYLDFLFFPDRYFGDLYIEGVGVTQTPGALLSLRLESLCPLIYRDSDGQLTTVGFIESTSGMRSFVIGLHEDGRWSGDGGLMLTFPAIDRPSAVGTASSILSDPNAAWAN